MTLGGEMLMKKFGGTRLSVAEAFLRGELNELDEEHLHVIVTPLILDAAKFRVKEGLGQKNSGQ